MKNWEFYEEELKKYNIAFAMRDNQIGWCSNTLCSECAFGTNEGISCSEAKFKWLYQEHKEPIVLTDDEKALCKLFNRGWIARDKNDRLYWYETKPKEKFDYKWRVDYSAYTEISTFFPQCKFDFIKWEDKEPWTVKVDD